MMEGDCEWKDDGIELEYWWPDTAAYTPLYPGFVVGMGDRCVEDTADDSAVSGNKVRVGMSSQTCWTIFLDLMPPGPDTVSVLFTTKCT